MIIQSHKLSSRSGKHAARYFSVSLFLFTMGLATQSWAAGPLLVVGSVAGKAGNVVELPIHFDPGTASIAGIQFNLTLPANTSVVSANPGPNLKAEGKSVSSNHHGQTWTFIVFGMNQNTNKGGTLLTAQVQIAPGTTAGKLKVPVSGVVYTDPNGKAIATGTPKTGSITIQ